MSITIANHTDAALLLACATFHKAGRALIRLNAKGNSTDAEIAPVVDAWAAPIDTIIALPATTMAGVMAKAQAVIIAFETGVDRRPGQTIEDTADDHELMAWTLAHEILAMGRALV